jgi:threonine dehydrogenase-like Zn-dependent dehydrogenase
LVSRGLVDVGALISHRIRLEDSEKAFRIAEAREGIKVIITT